MGYLGRLKYFSVRLLTDEPIESLCVAYHTRSSKQYLWLRMNREWNYYSQTIVMKACLGDINYMPASPFTLCVRAEFSNPALGRGLLILTVDRIGIQNKKMLPKKDLH
jgi:hypothetical protein